MSLSGVKRTFRFALHMSAYDPKRTSLAFRFRPLPRYAWELLPSAVRAFWGATMRRRQFLGLLGGAVAVWPVVLRAQQPAGPVIGFMNAGSSKGLGRLAVAFRQGLSESGFVENQNITIEYHWAEGHAEQLPAMAADLVRRRVSVIAATSTPAALAAKAATTTIPVVFETAGDPIALGLVASLNRPSRNVTGITQLSSELVAKRLSLLHDLIPAASTVGFLVNPTDPRFVSQTKDMQEAAKTFGVQIQVVNASTDGELESGFAELSQLRVGALMVGTGEFFNSRPEKIVGLAARQHIPAMYQYRRFAEVGGLISYGPHITDAYRQAGIYTARILKGEKPADLPVVRATKFEMVINRKTAKTLGLTIPSGVLAIADEVIDEGS
jgi:putative tryptophan/tyrosine transport system substrate-binding protein